MVSGASGVASIDPMADNGMHASKRATQSAARSPASERAMHATSTTVARPARIGMTRTPSDVAPKITVPSRTSTAMAGG